MQQPLVIVKSSIPRSYVSSVPIPRNNNNNNKIIGLKDGWDGLHFPLPLWINKFQPRPISTNFNRPRPTFVEFVTISLLNRLALHKTVALFLIEAVIRAACSQPHFVSELCDLDFWPLDREMEESARLQTMWITWRGAKELPVTTAGLSRWKRFIVQCLPEGTEELRLSLRTIEMVSRGTRAAEESARETYERYADLVTLTFDFLIV